MGWLICQECAKRYTLRDPVWKCACGGLLDIEFQPSFPVEAIGKRKPNLWRYREAIPLQDDGNVVSFEEGFTPLLPVEFFGKTVWLKQDHLFPTGSYKDRGASVLVSKIRELGIKTVVEDSSGNAGCAIAAYCARAGIACEIFVPEETSPGKIAQIRMYGAALRRVPGSREDTSRAVLKAAEKTYYASHSWNPFFFQGTKTFAFEICEQLGWKAPDAVVVPVGNGTLLLGVYIGFRELWQSGITRRVPKIIGVQSANCAPLFKSFSSGSDRFSAIAKKETLAEGIAIAEPVRGRQILQAVRETGGGLLAVSESEIEAALLHFCGQGFYLEPTSAATLAGVSQYLSSIRSEDCIVSLITGHGLKSTEKMLKIIEKRQSAARNRR